jgi:acyl-coenzyme A synthetase/AMP-(fatty) acid ligase
MVRKPAYKESLVETQMATLQEMAQRVLDFEPSRPALEYEGRWLTWGELRRVADKVNALIDANGAAADAPVAFIPRNRPEILAALLGCIARGRYIRMIHVYQSPAGLARDIRRLKPATVVAQAPDMAEGEVLAVLRENGVAGIACAEIDAAAVAGCERSTAAYDPPPAEPIIDLLTSGTTGPPKQFPLTYEFLARDMGPNNAAVSARTEDPVNQAPWLLFWPFGNFSGLYATLFPVLQGFRGILVDRFKIDIWLDYVRMYRPEWMNLPPPGFKMLLDLNVPKKDLASIKVMQSGAAPLDPNVQRAFEDRYGIPILLMYGATEFGGPVSYMTEELYRDWGRKKLGSVGRPLPGTKIRVVDPETGQVLPAGREGLLEVVAPRIGPQWIRTSDMAIIDEDGFMWHRGRADGAIMRGGFKVLPDTIEQALLLHDSVAAAAVTAIPDERLGQVPAAAITLRPDKPRVTVAELEKHLRQHVESTHVPTDWRFVEEIPYNALNKVDRAALRRLFETVEAG